MPSFAAAFVGEALRITWQAWKSTRTTTILADFACNGAAPRPSFWLDRSETELNIHHSSTESNRSYFYRSCNVSRVPQGGRDLEAYSTRNSQSVMITEETEVHPIPIQRKNRFKNCFSGLGPGANWRGPLILCLVPLLCGIPQLFLIWFIFLQDKQAWIFAGALSCRVRSVAVDKLAAMTLLVVLALTAAFSFIILLILCSTRRSVNQYGRSNLDMTFLLPIAFLSVQSVVGCLVVAIVYFTSRDQYTLPLEFLGVINPTISAFVLTDRGFYINWYGWIRRLICLPRECLGLRNNEHAPDSSVMTIKRYGLWSHCHQRSKINFEGAIWVPPKPSYPRSHRPISMSSVGDWEFEDEDEIASQNVLALGRKNGRHPTISRPSHLNVDRKASQRNRKSGASRHLFSMSRRCHGATPFRRSTCRQPDTTSRSRARRKVFTVEFANVQISSTETWIMMNEMRRSVNQPNSTLSQKNESSNSDRISVPTLPVLSTSNPRDHSGLILRCSHNDAGARRTWDDILQYYVSPAKRNFDRFNIKPSKSL